MLLTLVLPLAVAPIPSHPPTPAVGDDPPIRVSLNHDGHYLRGDRARVEVRAADDGYIVVLRADGSGRVRVLFPLDPGDDAFIRGGKTFEVRGRGDREAFVVDDRDGGGMVLAAWSPDALRFHEFLQGDHWDYRALGAGAVGDDPEAGLLEIVRRMAGRYEHDFVPYLVESSADYPHDSHHGHSGAYGCPGCGWGGLWGISFSIGFGWGYPYSIGFGWGYPYSFYPFYPYAPACWWPCSVYPYYGYPYYGYPYSPYYAYRPYGYRYARPPFVPKTTVFGSPAVNGPRFEPRQRGAITAPRRGDAGASIAPRKATASRLGARAGTDAPRGLRQVNRGWSGGERRSATARSDATRSSWGRGDAGRTLSPRSGATGRSWSGWGGRAAGRGSVRASPGMGRGAAGRGSVRASPGMGRGAGGARGGVGMRGRR
jgi:hypothetical protein